ncbi:hydroxypyruvate isomerase [Sphingomonas zeicaulis]|uniref:TIM barrel protein n=1 Tax=Sphingomonas zeicaulis TaxID=1632740 RepID=UPI003D20B31B
MPLLRASAGSTDPVAQIACAARLGFAGVTDNLLKLRAPPVRRDMRLALRDHGLAMGSFVHDPPGASTCYWGQRMADIEGALATTWSVAADIGGGIVNLIVLDGGGPRDDQLGHATDNLAIAARMAAERGVMLALESISRARVPHALDVKVTALARLVRTIGSPALGLILDSCHCDCNGEDMAGAIVRHVDILAGVQFADMPGRVEPGAGKIDFKPIMSALDMIGWKGLIETEFMPAANGSAGERAALDALTRLP